MLPECSASNWLEFYIAKTETESALIIYELRQKQPEEWEVGCRRLGTWNVKRKTWDMRRGLKAKLNNKYVKVPVCVCVGVSMCVCVFDNKSNNNKTMGASVECQVVSPQGRGASYWGNHKFIHENELVTFLLLLLLLNVY